MGCMADCMELSPPPDSILLLPPPPVPETIINGTACAATQVCDALTLFVKSAEKENIFDGQNQNDDTWIFILIASTIGVLFLGALLAMFLLKCREMSLFGGSDSSRRSMKIPSVAIEGSMHNGSLHSRKSTRPSDVMFHPTSAAVANVHQNQLENQLVWAALTPKGDTQHFISQYYPRSFQNPYDDHYETVENLMRRNIYQQPYCKAYDVAPTENSGCDSGFADSEYEEPINLAPYRNDDDYQYSTPGVGNADMRCISNAAYVGSMRRSLLGSRPVVSSPTKIDRPNLPPLNLHPHSSGTLKRNALTLKHVEGTLPKYAC